MGKLIDFPHREIQPAIDKETFLEMILSEEKREEVFRKFNEMDYVEEEFHVRSPLILDDDNTRPPR
ncbi:hypothetical protein [Alicyclobacillus mengziensis]|uniref:Uncharacterized protein n=1 Tax=Alicyclobacillus mengziensis TaxID=2931921 RepID=A0A9X7W097_9BACL|nr:hypothetical protein [Alicyclobacillus mengziensis]QSO48373.1 hypothetical protein JZ786_05135 [Alicyclobacillus mengziensis]